MGELSKVIVIDPDDRARRQLQLGFAREGVPAVALDLASFAAADVAKLELPVEDVSPGLVIIRGTEPGAIAALARVRAILTERGSSTRILFAGHGVDRAAATAAGADEVMLLPAYLRDIVIIGRLLREPPAPGKAQLAGNLVDTTTVYTLVRALAALGRSAVLTMIRGLRRGEVRFFHGEVTSAQVGLIHGQAALHQLLLWTDARFDFHHEDVVRRQQIPLEHDELFADAERFLAGVRDSSGSLSPSMVLEQDMQRVQALGKQIPTEVHGVLRMFDGHRVLADVLEDSPYRVFETLRVAQRAVDVGLLRAASQSRKKATWRAVLAIEEWLVGTEERERPSGTGESGPLTATASRDSQRHNAVAGDRGKAARRKRRKRRANTPVPVPPTSGTSGVTAAGGGSATGNASRASGEIDWGSLVPRTLGAEAGPLAPVVPSSKASGEITTPTRENPRERLESVMDTGKRDRFFPTDIGLEPSVVLGGDDAAPTPAPPAPSAPIPVPMPKSDRETQKHGKRAKADAKERKAKADALAQADAEARARAAETARTQATASAAATAQAEAAAAAARADADRERLADSAKSAHDLVKRLVAEETGKPVPPLTSAAAPAPLETAAVIATETPSATVLVGDRVSVTHTERTARLVAEPVATITEPAKPVPQDISDEPSDGVPRTAVITAETAPVVPPLVIVAGDDRPDPKVGEIAERAKRATPETASAAVPSILVTDIAAVQTAISAVVPAQVAAPATPDAANPARESAVAAVRADAEAAAFTAMEEEFFANGATDTAMVPKQSFESFDDLDAGYQPPTFWERLLGKKTKR